MVPKSKNSSTFSDLTPKIGGKDLSELLKLWKDIARSEVRLKLMRELRKKDLGFNEIENFRLGLRYNLKSEKLREKSSKPIQKVIKSAMDLKMRDETNHLNEMKKQKEQRRKHLSRKYHPNTVTHRKVIKFLRGEAERIKREQGEKNWRKLQHLNRKHKEEEEEKLAQAPPGMESLSHLSVFNNEKYDEIETDTVEVPKIGEIELTEAGGSCSKVHELHV